MRYTPVIQEVGIWPMMRPDSNGEFISVVRVKKDVEVNIARWREQFEYAKNAGAWQACSCLADRALGAFIVAGLFDEKIAEMFHELFKEFENQITK